MSDDRLTPELQALVDAALRYDAGDIDTIGLRCFIAEYKASLRPQPVECLMTRSPSYGTPGGWGVARDPSWTVGGWGGEVWRVTITPIERVR